MASNCGTVEELVLSDMSSRLFSDTGAGLGLQILGRRMRRLTATNVRADELRASDMLACRLLTDLCIAFTYADIHIANQVSDTGIAATAHESGLWRVTLKLCRAVTSEVAALAVLSVMELVSLEAARSSDGGTNSG